MDSPLEELGEPPAAFLVFLRLVSSWLKVWYWGKPEEDPEGGGGTMVGSVGGVPCRLLWKGVPDSEMVERVGMEEREVKLMAEMGGGDSGVRLAPPAEVVAGEPVWHEDSIVLVFFRFLPTLGT